jgi:hypothetical protein
MKILFVIFSFLSLVLSIITIVATELQKTGNSQEFSPVK